MNDTDTEPTVCPVCGQPTVARSVAIGGWMMAVVLIITGLCASALLIAGTAHIILKLL